MPRRESGSDIPPERAEQLRLEVTELENRRAELSALLQLPLTIESMKQSISDLNAEAVKVREEATQEYNRHLFSLKANLEDEKETLESQMLRLYQERNIERESLLALQADIESAQESLRIINKKIEVSAVHLGKLKDDCGHAEALLQQKKTQMDSLIEGTREMTTALSTREAALDKTKQELNVKNNNLDTLQNVIAMQLAEARNRLIEVEAREDEVKAAHTKNCDEYNDLILKASRQEDEFGQREIRLSRELFLVGLREDNLAKTKADLDTREKDLSTNWEVFKKERAKHDWANREK